MIGRRQLAKLLNFFQPAEDLVEEIQIHLRMEEQENLDAGMPAAEARYAALRRFGNVTQTQEISRRLWQWNFAEQLFQDLRFGLRQLARNPGFACIAIVTLALGMGGTTAIFSLMNALLLKPLPVPEPDRLVQLTHGNNGEHGPSLPYPLFENLRQQGEASVEFFGFSYAYVQQVRGSAELAHQSVQIVTGNFYEGLRIQPELGRLLTPADDKQGGDRNNAAVISDRLWRGPFHADPNIAGQKIVFDGVPFIITGVLPPGFFGVVPGEAVDIAITFAGFAVFAPRQMMLTCRDCNTMEAMGRLKPRVDAKRAEAALQIAWHSALRQTLPEHLPSRYQNEYFSDRAFLDAATRGSSSYYRDRFTNPLYLMLAMSVFILLIACSNVANLLLGRAEARQRELAVRLSTGASRGRVIRQLLSESLLLAIFGMAAGVSVYQFGVRGLLWFMNSNGDDVFLDTTPDSLMLCFAAGLMVVTVLLFGFAPALRATRTGLRSTLSASAATATRQSRLGSLILVCQIALSVTLLIDASLLSRSLSAENTFDAGFRRDHLLIVSPDVAKNIPRPEDQLRFEQHALSRISRLPGVRSVSLSSMLPTIRGLWLADFTADGQQPANKQDTECRLNFVTSRYLETMGIPLLLGRNFEERDQQPGAPSVAILSESAARQFWGNENPVGKKIHELEKTEHFTVIGVARDAKNRNFQETSPRTIYLRYPPPLLGMSWTNPLEVWTAQPPELMIGPVRKTLEQENPQVPVEFHAFKDLLDHHLLTERLFTMVSIWFGALGLLMAAIGIYGVTAYSVKRRLLEVGIRRALGAARRQIVWLFLRNHLGLACVGFSVGVTGAWVLTKFLKAWLFGVSALDLTSFTGSVALLATVSLFATLIPVVRALRWQAASLLRLDG